MCQSYALAQGSLCSPSLVKAIEHVASSAEGASEKKIGIISTKTWEIAGNTGKYDWFYEIKLEILDCRESSHPSNPKNLAKYLAPS